MEIYNSAVCNCHKEDEFSPLISLLGTGFLFADKSKKKSEQISFGLKLRKELEKFRKKFVPHMKEEEEEFQPLLFKYFTIDELKEMKTTVIKLHLQNRKRNLDNIKQETSKLVHLKVCTISNLILSSKELTLHENKNIYIKNKDSSTISLNDLPNEILLKIFSFLSFNEKFKVTRVCKRWYSTIYDPKYWKELCFDQWNSNVNQFESSFFKNRKLDDIGIKSFDREFEYETKEFNKNKIIGNNEV
jgi:F-box/leucine-rich repeat protein 5